MAASLIETEREARSIRHRACGRKRAYPDAGSARAAMHHPAVRREARRRQCRVYRCCFCRRWHWGSQLSRTELRRLAEAVRVLSGTLQTRR